MRVRLLTDLDAFQKAGSIIEVSEEYGRKYLIPHRFGEKVVEEKHNEWDPKDLNDSESGDLEVVKLEFRRQMFNGGIRKWSVRGLNRIFDSVA